MRQLGAAAFNMKGKLRARFSMNLSPLPGAKVHKPTMNWWATQPLEIRKRVFLNGKEPRAVMRRFAVWANQFPKPKMMMAPVMFDGTWLRYYLERFVGHSDFWHNALDLRSVVWSFTGLYEGDYKRVIESLTGKDFADDHTHIAVEDAIEQAHYLFALIQFAEEKNLRVKL